MIEDKRENSLKWHQFVKLKYSPATAYICLIKNVKQVYKKQKQKLKLAIPF